MSDENSIAVHATLADHEGRLTALEADRDETVTSGERAHMRDRAEAAEAERDRLRAEVERITKERDMHRENTHQVSLAHQFERGQRIKHEATITRLEQAMPTLEECRDIEHAVMTYETNVERDGNGRKIARRAYDAVSRMLTWHETGRVSSGGTIVLTDEEVDVLFLVIRANLEALDHVVVPAHRQRQTILALVARYAEVLSGRLASRKETK